MVAVTPAEPTPLPPNPAPVGSARLRSVEFLISVSAIVGHLKSAERGHAATFEGRTNQHEMPSSNVSTAYSAQLIDAEKRSTTPRRGKTTMQWFFDEPAAAAFSLVVMAAMRQIYWVNHKVVQRPGNHDK
jgi:hypothetical protein